MSFEHDDALRGYIRRARILETDDSGPQLRLRARGLARVVAGLARQGADLEAHVRLARQ